jgi:hypothetical protein
VRFADVGPAGADRLDLGAGEADARLDPFDDLVVVERLAVGGDLFDLGHVRC